jgi:hypothetical protein
MHWEEILPGKTQCHGELVDLSSGCDQYKANAGMVGVKVVGAMEVNLGAWSGERRSTRLSHILTWIFIPIPTMRRAKTRTH